MKLLRNIVAAATAFAAVPAFALNFIAAPIGSGPYTAWDAFTTPDASTTFVSDRTVYGAKLPVNAITFLAVLAGGQATVSAWGASSFGFEWGTPDNDNLVTYHTSTGDVAFSGLQLYQLAHFPPPAANDDVAFAFWAFGDPGQTIDSVTFGFTGPTLHGFEVAAIPEPATTALMLAGLGVLGLGARRRRRAVQRGARMTAVDAAQSGAAWAA